MHNLSHRQVIMFTVPHYLHMREDSQLIQTVTSLAGNSCFGRWQNVSIQIEKSCVYRGMLKALSQITPYAFLPQTESSRIIFSTSFERGLILQAKGSGCLTEDTVSRCEKGVKSSVPDNARNIFNRWLENIPVFINRFLDIEAR